jgi:UDP-N-acetylglucosamine 2-epimerase (non-hydrolysing)
MMGERPIRVLSVVGARPNFMKVAPIARALAAHPAGFAHVLVHTGQHYDARMSDAFFTDLQMPAPDFHLGVGSGSHARQTAAVMVGIEPVLTEVAPDLLIVVGDVNSTLAAALTAKKLGLAVAHVEAGLRSHDMAMPEEINRRCVDSIADELFTTDRLAEQTLLGEGASQARIHFVGNVMIDSLLAHRPAAEALAYHRRLGLKPGGYATLTLHRPSNVEDAEALAGLINAVRDATAGLPVIFPIHPRTRARVEAFGLGHLFAADPAGPGVFLTEPLGYLEFLSLNQSARIVVTDSGGLQEETTLLGVPCVTLRTTTERPITVTEGTNRLAGVTPQGVRAGIRDALAAGPQTGRRPEKWDGRAAERIADVIALKYGAPARAAQ